MPAPVRHPGSVGGPPPGGELRVTRPGSDVPAEAGEIGEVQIRSAAVFLGYYGDPEATRAALTEQRWYRTGDFGRIVDGTLVLEGRRTDLIIRGGENIYPREIEDRLLEHPDVTDAVVVGVPHRVLGEEVKAVVVAQPGVDVEAGALQAWVGATLAPMKIPARVEFRRELPKNALGKTVRYLLDSETPNPFAETWGQR